jgi:enolase
MWTDSIAGESKVAPFHNTKKTEQVSRDVVIVESTGREMGSVNGKPNLGRLNATTIIALSISHSRQHSMQHSRQLSKQLSRLLSRLLSRQHSRQQIRQLSYCHNVYIDR